MAGSTPRLIDLRKYAHGKPCMVRIPGICSGDSSTVCLAHVRRGNVGGIGKKPPDAVAVWACFACHNVMDGRASSPFTRNDIDSMLLGALCRQHARYQQEGLRYYQSEPEDEDTDDR